MTNIIDPKYAERYRGDGDFLSSLIKAECYVQLLKDGKDGEKVNNGKPILDLEKLFDLAEANGIPAREKYSDQTDRKNAAGRLRMTIGNSLRAAARKRHGLYTAAGVWKTADKNFIGDHPLTEQRNGAKIVKEAESA